MNAPETDGAGVAPGLADETPAFELARDLLDVVAHPGRRPAAATATVVELPTPPGPRTARLAS